MKISAVSTIKNLLLFVFISLSFGGCEKKTDFLGDDRLLGVWYNGNDPVTFSSDKKFSNKDSFGDPLVRPYYTEYDSLFIVNENKLPWKSKYTIEGDTLTLVYLNGVITVKFNR